MSSVSGSGNNWAVGHYRYGVDYRESILETVRVAAEACDCLQSFMILHSMGGGTGSGLGTSVLGLLKDEYPDVYVPGLRSSPSPTFLTSSSTLLRYAQLCGPSGCWVVVTIYA